MDKNLQFDKYLLMVEYTFRWSGLPLRNRNNINVKKQRFLYCINSLLLNTCVVGAICWIIKGAARGEGLVSLTNTAPSILLALISDVKSLSLLWYQDQADKLIFKLRELETKADLESNDHKTLIKAPIKFLHYVLKISSFCNWLFIISFPLMPLSTSIYNYFVLNTMELVLPFYVEYPFDAYDIKIYPFILFYNLYTGKEIFRLFILLNIIPLNKLTLPR